MYDLRNRIDFEIAVIKTMALEWVSDDTLEWVGVYNRETLDIRGNQSSCDIISVPLYFQQFD